MQYHMRVNNTQTNTMTTTNFITTTSPGVASTKTSPQVGPVQPPPNVMSLAQMTDDEDKEDSTTMGVKTAHIANKNSYNNNNNNSNKIEVKEREDELTVVTVATRDIGASDASAIPGADSIFIASLSIPPSAASAGAGVMMNNNNNNNSSGEAIAMTGLASVATNANNLLREKTEDRFATQLVNDYGLLFNATSEEMIRILIEKYGAIQINPITKETCEQKKR